MIVKIVFRGPQNLMDCQIIKIVAMGSQYSSQFLLKLLIGIFIGDRQYCHWDCQSFNFVVIKVYVNKYRQDSHRLAG